MDPPCSPAKVAIEGRLGKPLTVRIMDDWNGKAGVATSSEMGVLEEATGSAINTKSLSNAIGLLENSRSNISEFARGRVVASHVVGEGYEA